MTARHLIIVGALVAVAVVVYRRRKPCCQGCAEGRGCADPKPESAIPDVPDVAGVEPYAPAAPIGLQTDMSLAAFGGILDRCP